MRYLMVVALFLPFTAFSAPVADNDGDGYAVRAVENQSDAGLNLRDSSSDSYYGLGFYPANYGYYGLGYYPSYHYLNYATSLRYDGYYHYDGLAPYLYGNAYYRLPSTYGSFYPSFYGNVEVPVAQHHKMMGMGRHHMGPSDKTMDGNVEHKGAPAADKK